MKNCNLIHRLIRYALFIGLAVLLFGCSSNGLASTKATLNIQGTKPLTPLINGFMSLASIPSIAPLSSVSVNLSVVSTNGTGIGTLIVTDAKVSLKEIKLIQGGAGSNSAEADEDNGTEVDEDNGTEVDGGNNTEIDEDNNIEVDEDNASVDFEGPFVVDLLADTVTPTPGTATILVGVYTQIEGELDCNPALNGSSIYLEGYYTGPTASGPVADMPFTLSFELNDEFQLTGDGNDPVGINVGEGITNQIIIAFRLNKWFRFDDPQTNPDSVNFSDVVPNGGVIQLIINSGDTDAICEVIESNIVSSGDFGEDINGDGQLGSDEDADQPSEDELDE